MNETIIINDEYCWMHDSPHGGWTCELCRVGQTTEEEAMGEDREMSEEEAQRFDALMQEDVEHTRNGYGA